MRKDGEGLGSVLREVARLQLQIQRVRATSCGGTTSTQCFVIGELGRAGPTTVVELGRRLAIDKGWASRAVDALAEEGLVAKSPGELDRRTVTVALTRAGRARFRALDAALDAQAGAVMARIPRKERAAVAESLRLLRVALREEAGRGA